MKPKTHTQPGAARREGLSHRNSNRPSLTRMEFRRLADTPPDTEWFTNIMNSKTRKAYQADLADYMGFAGIQQLGEFRKVVRAHVIAWRGSLEHRGLSSATIRRKLSRLTESGTEWSEEKM